MKLLVIVLAVVVVGQWIALAEISTDSSCPVTAIAQEKSVSSSTAADAWNNFTKQAKPAAASSTEFGTETKLKTTALHSPVVGSSIADFSPVSAKIDDIPPVAAKAEEPSPKDNSSKTNSFSRKMDESLKELSESMKHSVSVQDLMVIAALIASSLLLYFWKRRPVQSVTPASSSSEENLEPMGDERHGSWMIEINIDDSTRQAIFRAVRYMGLRVLRRGKYSLSLGSYPNKIEASRIVQKLHKRYGVRGWLVEAPERPAQSERYLI